MDNIIKIIASDGNRETVPSSLDEKIKYDEGRGNFGKGILAVKFIEDCEETEWYLNPQAVEDSPNKEEFSGWDTIPPEFIPELLLFPKCEYLVSNFFDFLQNYRIFETDKEIEEILKMFEKYLIETR